LWQRRYGGDRNIIGREVDLGGKTTVIGVLPAGFEFPISDEKQDYWEPMMSAAFLTQQTRETRDDRFLGVVGRMKSGVAIEQAKAELDVLSKQIEQQYPKTNTNIVFTVGSMHEDITRDYRPALLVMFGAVGLVLLIACANVANLLLARVAARQKEVAIRTALGASRGRIVMQFLIESLLLSLAGGAVGLLLASWGVSMLVAYGPSDVPRLQEVGLDRYVLGFTFGATVLTGLLFGLAPALQAAKPNPNNTLKESGRGPSQHGRSRMRSALIVSEVALSLMLLVGAALLINSFVRLLKTNAGFNPSGVLALDIPLSRTRYPKGEQQAATFQQLLQRMKTVPGVRDVALTSNVPLTDFDVELSFNIEGRPPYKPGEELVAEYTVASSDYFRAMNIPLQRGRELSENDTKGMPEVLVVTDAFVKRFFPGEDPIGRRLVFDGPDKTPREIVGVVGDVKRKGLDADVQPEVYVSYLQRPDRRLNVLLKTDLRDAGQLIQPARAA
jgi:predicted permease